MAAQTWTTIQQTVAVALTQQLGTNLTAFSPTFNAQFPLAISWAEDRIYEGVPLLAARQNITIANATTQGSRLISLSALSPLPSIIEEVYLVAPFSFLTDDLGHVIDAGQSGGNAGSPIEVDGGAGTPIAYDRVSIDFIYRYWPQQFVTAAPTWPNYGRYFAMLDNQTIALAPTPDGTYPANIVAFVPPIGLSATNTTTYLSSQYPDALISGALVYLAGALTRNFGAQSDEPRQAVSWRTAFAEWIAVINDEERRRRGLAPNTPQPPQPEAARQAQ